MKPLGGKRRVNIFYHDKAPYVLVLLVSVLSWHLTQIGSEITRTQAVTYRLDIDRQTGEVVTLIRNVSRAKSIVGATFSISCAEVDECFAPIREPGPGEEPVYGEARKIAPTGPAVDVDDRMSTAGEVMWTSTVPPGGRYEILARLDRPDANIEFFFTPTAANTIDILVYDSRTPTGFLVENYFKILVGSLVVFAVLLAASVIANMRPWIPPDSSGEAGDGSGASNQPLGADDRRACPQPTRLGRSPRRYGQWRKRAG